MNPKDSFNKSIRELKKDPASNATKMIEWIEKYSSQSGDYYFIFDDFAYRLGISIQAIEVTDQKSGKVKGYLPCLKYYPNNPLNEESRLDHLTSNTLKENKCYELLAKELLYRIMRIKDIEKLLQLS